MFRRTDGYCYRAKETRRCCTKHWVSWFCGRTTASGLQGTFWITAHGLKPLADQPPLIEQLWLLLPQGTVNTKAGRQCLRRLRVQITKAVTMPDPHENKC